MEQDKTVHQLTCYGLYHKVKYNWITLLNSNLEMEALDVEGGIFNKVIFIMLRIIF